MENISVSVITVLEIANKHPNEDNAVNGSQQGYVCDDEVQCTEICARLLWVGKVDTGKAKCKMSLFCFS